MALEDLLTDVKPFGPVDQSRIADVEDAVALLDIGEPLKSGLSGNYTLVYGRKGCGKSSILSIFDGYQYAQRRLQSSEIEIDDAAARIITVKIDTWDKFLDIETHVMRIVTILAGRDNSLALDYELLPPEAVERVWIEYIWDQIFRKIRDMSFEDERLAAAVPSVLICFSDEKMARMRGTPDYVASKVFTAARSEVLTLLRVNNFSIFVLFDSMDRYPIRNSTFSVSMSGFLRAINTISIQHPKLRVIAALPEEMLPHFKSASSNILKDFESSFPMRWKQGDLLRMAAFRYSLFLKINDLDYYNSTITKINLNSRSGLKAFYDSLLPERVVNEVGGEEHPIPYILRHTHFMPRHLIISLNEIAQRSHGVAGDWHRFTPESIVDGVKATEEKIASEIMQPYEMIYKGIGKELSKSFTDLPPFFSYGQLDKAVRRIPAIWDLEKGEIFLLLFRMGIIGRVLPQGRTVQYCTSEFFFTFEGNINFSGKDEICFHPVFSRYFNAYMRRNGDTRIVYPRGVEQ